jgi:hypothetical protein
MTKDDLKARGYPGGDEQLMQRYIAKFGAEQTWPIFESSPTGRGRSSTTSWPKAEGPPAASVWRPEPSTCLGY